MPLFHRDSGTPYSVNHQNSPTASFQHGHYLNTLIKNNLTSKLWHQEWLVHEEQTLAAVIIMFGSILCLLPLNCHALK